MIRKITAACTSILILSMLFLLCGAADTVDFNISAPIAGHSASVTEFATADYYATASWFCGTESVDRFAVGKVYTAKIDITPYNDISDASFKVNGNMCTLVSEPDGRYSVSYTFPAIAAKYEVYVRSSGNDSATGTSASPYRTLKKAISALSGTGGVVHICDNVSGSGNFAANSLPILITGAGYSGATLTFSNGSGLVANGELIFEDLTISMGDSSHFNDKGNKITIADSVHVPNGKMFHLGAYSSGTVERADLTLGKNSSFGTVYLGGGYLTDSTHGIAGDAFVTLNSASVKALNIGIDSYAANHTGGYLGGNILLTLNGNSTLNSIVNNKKTLNYSDTSVFQIVLNNCTQSISVPAELFDKNRVYIIKSGKNGKVLHAKDKNGKSVSGYFDIVPDKGHVAMVNNNGTSFISHGGRYPLAANADVNITYIKCDYALENCAIDLCGGFSDRDLVSIDADGNIHFHATPEKDNCIFEGWYADEQYTTLVKDGDFVGSSFGIYAKYIPVYLDHAGKEFAVNGVQIRFPGYGNPQGLRFVSSVSNDLLASISDFSDKNSFAAGSDTGYGTVVIPSLYLGKNELFADAEYEYNGKTYKSKTVPAKNLFNTEEDYISYTACVVNIDKSKYTSSYSVRPYIKYYTRSGNLTTAYARMYSSDVVSTTFAAIESGKETAENCDYMRSEIIAAYAEQEGIEVIPQDVLAEINSKTQQYKQNVLNSKNYDVTKATGNVYYVSNSGNDSNDGNSPQTAWATISKVNGSTLASGDVVLFERGDMFRGKISGKAGVTYSAYGEGAKPVINGSTRNYANASYWVQTSVPNVYKLNLTLSSDVGFIAFDHDVTAIGKYDELASLKRVPGITYNGKLFSGINDLDTDLSFSYSTSSRTVYLYSKYGNPGKRFSSIEISTQGHLFSIGGRDIIVDNLHFRYGGSHGVGGGGGKAYYDADGNFLNITSSQNITVKNCIFAWIGGSILSNTTRYGNAVEMYGSVDGYVVDNCWIYQIYDTGITHQYSSSNAVDTMMKDIHYKNNLVEYCHWSIEFYNAPCCNASVETHRKITKNVLVEDNILRMGGYGWGSTTRKGEATLYNSFGLSHKPEETQYFHARNNIFFCSSGRIIRLTSNESERNLTFEGNTYVQTYNKDFSHYCGRVYTYDKDISSLLDGSKQLDDPGCKIYYYAP